MEPESAPDSDKPHGPAAGGGDFVDNATMAPGVRWALIEEALMAPEPGLAFLGLRDSGALRGLLPEVQALFGVPHLCDLPEAVDVGLHQLRLLDEFARIDAPVALRFAGLMHKVGMGGTPREIWPSHYKHEQRGHAALLALSSRIAVPEEAVALAHLTIDEVDRVHRVSDLRAGPIAAMLHRLDALGQPARFEQLMVICTCDHAAYPGHHVADYTKAGKLRRALDAYAATDVTGCPADEALERRALAVAQALNSLAGLT